jgi:hypothetical protein
VPDPILIRLTQTELQLLLRSLEITTLPGIADDLLAGLNEEQQKEALVVAEQTLRARRFVGWDKDLQRVINPFLANLLLDCTHPDYTLFVDTALPTGRGIPFLYIFGKHGIYEVCQPEPDIVQFRIVGSTEELERRLSPRLPEVLPAESGFWSGRIKQKLLNTSLSLAGQDEEAAFRSFKTVLYFELAQALAAAYHAPRVVQYIARWQAVPTKEQPRPQAALTILQGSEYAFLLWVEDPERGEESPVSVELFHSDSLRRYIKQVVPPKNGENIDPPKNVGNIYSPKNVRNMYSSLKGFE